jgi:hypothetical protein
VGTKYSSIASSGFDASPPADDGSQVAANLITWSGIKSKLASPLKTEIDAINSALVTAFDYSVRQITSSDNTVAADHMKCVEIAPTVTTAVTVSLGDATTMTNNYRVFVKNSSLVSQTVGRVTAGDTIDGATANFTLPPRSGAIFQTTTGATGYLTVSAAYPLAQPVLRSYLAGLTLSTAGGSATMTIAAGMATDSTNAATMALASAIGKTTSAWAVGTGNGGLDTGAIANSTWYHFYLIMRTDTGVVDVLFSTSASAPTMPTNYTYKRRIGSGKTDGSAQWTAFIQDGDYFRWLASVLDVNVTNPGTAAVTRTLTVPTGVNVFAIFNSFAGSSTAGVICQFSDLAANDELPSGAAAPLGNAGVALTNTQLAVAQLIRTNTSSQIRSRLQASDVNTSLLIATLGWNDRRGRDA